jgi:hypothetical protein
MGTDVLWTGVSTALEVGFSASGVFVDTTTVVV